MSSSRESDRSLCCSLCFIMVLLQNICTTKANTENVFKYTMQEQKPFMCSFEASQTIGLK